LEKIVEKIRRELRMGFYSMLTLKILIDKGELHGYGLRNEIRELSDGMFEPSEGTIYEMLKYLQKKGLIESYWAIGERGKARKIYRVTEKGVRIYKMICPDLQAFKKILEYLLEGCT